jgi:hypothetical protein
MELSSARELKQSLTETLLTTLGSTVRAHRAFGEPARTLAAGEGNLPTVALGLAPKDRGQFVLAVRVQQRALERGREVELIARQAKGEVDVRYIGLVTKRALPWYRQRQRPLRIGRSVGHVKVTAGTLGCFVRPQGGGPLAILSNNHVLANENRAKSDDEIVQPGTLDGGKAPNGVIAKLSKFTRLRRTGANFLDAATATLVEGIEADLSKLTGLGKLKGPGGGFLDAGTRVAKVGRTTGLTRGRVTAFEIDNVYVEYDLGVLRFDNQIEIEGEADGPFSQGGDSGSLIVDGERRGAALLFAGTDQGGANGQGLTYANPLADVLAALKIEMAV